MSLLGGLFHALTNPIGMLTDPIGTLVTSVGEDSAAKPEDIE